MEAIEGRLFSVATAVVTARSSSCAGCLVTLSCRTIVQWRTQDFCSGGGGLVLVYI